MYQHAVTNSMNPPSNQTSTTHFQNSFPILFKQLVEDLRRIFQHFGSLKELLNSLRLFIPLINTRNKKIKYWTHHRWNETKKIRFQLALNKTFCPTSTMPHRPTIKEHQIRPSASLPVSVSLFLTHSSHNIYLPS